MPMKNPAHPGRIIRSDMKAQGLTLEETALKLNVTPGELDKVINGELGVTNALALALGDLFGNGPDMWRRLQTAYDAAQQRNKDLATAEQPD